MARRAAPFFFFLLGVAAAVLGETSAAPVVDSSHRTPKESDGRRVVHVSSLSGELVAQEVAVKVGEEVTVELSNPAGTNYQWVYLGMHRQRDAVPLDPEGDGGKKQTATSDDDNNAVKEEDQEVKEDEEDGEQRASSLRGATEQPTMPGGMVTKTFELPAEKEAGKYYHFFAFWSNGEDATFRVVAVHAS